jgi:hypothetical protein
MSPIYAALLVVVGTVFGRHFYFRRFSIKIISRFGIPPEALDPHWRRNEKLFQTTYRNRRFFSTHTRPTTTMTTTTTTTTTNTPSPWETKWFRTTYSRNRRFFSTSTQSTPPSDNHHPTEQDQQQQQQQQEEEVESKPSLSLPPINESKDESTMESSTNNESKDDITIGTKNKVLADIIRNNYQSLNQTALEIQSTPQTGKSLFRRDERGPSPRQRSEEHLLLTTATTFLDSLDPDHILCVRGEPIVILKVEWKDSKLAICYWSLPFSILTDDTLSARDKQILEFRMHKVLTEQGGVQALQRGVHGALRHYYPPRLRLDPAPDDILLSELQYVMD